MQLDHIVWAVTDLEQGKEAFAELTGVTPENGGVHPGIGTHNALAALDKGVYIELIAPHPTREVDSPLTQHLEQLPQPELLAWAVSHPDLATVHAQLTSLGASSDGPINSSRREPSGHTLAWQLLFATDNPYRGLTPFFINWQETRHPSRKAPIAGRLLSFEVCLPEDSVAHNILNKSCANVSLKQGEPFVEVTFESQGRLIAWQSNQAFGFGL